MWIDLDHFKDINDIHGHQVGDQILRVVAEKLKFEMPADTVIARLGGDEFVVLCEGIKDAFEARLIGQQLRRLLNRPIEVGEKSLIAGASIGVAVFPDDATDAEDLLKNADLALYHAKAEGRGRCRHFTDELGQARQRRMVLSAHLRAAIENGEIQAHFQPLVHARDMHVVGFEALGRWFHPEFGAIPPPEFVKLAEENGLITPLTDVIMRKAIEAAKQWPEHVRVSVNVSPVQINSELVDQVRDIIKVSGLDPKRLELEVTEDVLIKDFDQTASMFARLRALGIQVAMDDFGAGYHLDGQPAAAQLRPAEDRPHLHHATFPTTAARPRSCARCSCSRASSISKSRSRASKRSSSSRSCARPATASCRATCSASPSPRSAFADAASLQFAVPTPRIVEPAQAAAIPIAARQARRAS